MRHLLVTLLVFVGCGRSSDAMVDRLDESRHAFEQREAELGHYTYVRASGSVFGFGQETSVEVSDDRVIARSFRSWHSGPNGEEVMDAMWSETGAEIGSHTEASPPKTMPQLYDECEQSILSVDRVANEVTLQLDASQLLAICEYRPKNCEDDCDVGIHLSSVTFAIP